MSSQPSSRRDSTGLSEDADIDNSKFKIHNSKLCFVCVGAGVGSRFGGDKLALELGDRTVLASAMGALGAAFPEAPLVVVVAPEKVALWRGRLGPNFPHAHLVAGGAHRHESVRAGVTVAQSLGAEVVAVHDAARPLVDPRDVRRVVGGLGDADGAVLTEIVADTVKRIDHESLVVETVDREGLVFALTPQVFRVASLRAAWEATGGGGGWTDESVLLERAGMRVRSVASRHPNPKLTVPSDLRVMRALAGVAQ